MQLPTDIAEKVAAWVKSIDIRRLRQASQQLTYQYQTGQQPISCQDEDQHLAYVITRMPATYSVCNVVLNQIGQTNVNLKSMLDLGAGPGTASLAVLNAFPQLTELTLVDRDPLFRSLALELLPHTGCLIRYVNEDLPHFTPQTMYDLVFCSYALNEISQDERPKIIAKAWDMTQQILILVEPGTPLGFAILKQARQQLIEAGAYVVAPCTHQNVCPLKENDWCHFSTHVDRSGYHRLTKNAELSYEHEKYSYLILARQRFPQHDYRIIKRPIQRSGHVIFDLCGESGVHRSTVSKKHKDRYTRARKRMWGDGWDREND
jgi:ribosomal protein RSM22 (predicted rRNA methylase)